MLSVCKYVSFMCSLCLSLCGYIGEIDQLLGSVFGDACRLRLSVCSFIDDGVGA